MNFYWLSGKRYCTICGTLMSRNGKDWICENPGHANRVTRSQAAKGTAGRKPAGKPVPVRFCPTCGIQMRRFKTLTGHTWKCPSPLHNARVRTKKRAAAKKARQGRISKRKK